ncbi:HAD family hydrolase [Novosphingobium sp. JCM 18896]|uniref:HAD family hydrolase n=1 Tax=Novosphingobium sp. JCM 18896 TaxID=2989731 RepID=UPI0022236E88|nr:haloacid dehalogenase-like hydrolase [Novosphingobium sp. JCM 18896]MCW1429416.1 haloacid dehalogenase-like hydrolase [Novosphingobium sp. JCM 18896]
MTVDLLVFDLDGTLVPTMEDYADQAASLMETHLGTPWDAARADYFRTSGLPFQKQLRQLYPQRADTDAVAERFEQWKDGYLRAIVLPAQVEQLFGEWRERGFRVAISSNNMQVYVDRLARDWPVDFALGFRPEDGFGKGEDHFRALESRFGLGRERMVFTGDSPNDARIARDTGVAFRALLTSAFAAEDFRAIDPQIVLLERLDQLVGTLAIG